MLSNAEATALNRVTSCNFSKHESIIIVYVVIYVVIVKSSKKSSKAILLKIQWKISVSLWDSYRLRQGNPCKKSKSIIKFNLLCLSQHYNSLLCYLYIHILTFTYSSCYQGRQQWKMIQLLEFIYNLITIFVLMRVIHFQVKNNLT